MIRNFAGKVLKGLLAAAGLARTTELERARRAIQAAERRVSHAAADASARVEALTRKLCAAREHAAAEHATHKTVLGLLRHYLVRLEQIEAQVADRVALVRRVKRRQLALSVKAARRHDISAAAAANAARLATLSCEYDLAVRRWRSGEVQGNFRGLTIAGLRWSVPADTVHEPSSARHSVEIWLPLDDLATVRQFAVGGVMLDIGAQVGATSIPRVLLGDFAQAYAAEPDGLYYLCLVGNTLDNHLDGRVLPDRVAISGSPGTVKLRRSDRGTEEVPSLTLDAWVQRLGIAAAEVRFVRIAIQDWNLEVLHGAANLLKRRQIVWQIEIQGALLRAGDGGVEDLADGIAAHFTHVKELGRYWAEQWRPSSDVGAVLRSVSDEHRAVNLLLFNLTGADGRERTKSEAGERTNGRPLISLLHATARLPDGWKPAMKAFMAKAKDPKRIEYILAVDEDEEVVVSPEDVGGWGRCTVVQKGVTGPSTAYNAAAQVARADILMQIADDYFPPEAWDEQIRGAIPDVTQEVVLDVDNSDGSTRLLPFSILTRAYYERYRYIFYPGYHGLFADYEFTEQARRDGVVRSARHIVFEHRHADRGLAPMDDVYARQKSHFAAGRKLFKERKAKGFPKWPS